VRGNEGMGGVSCDCLSPVKLRLVTRNLLSLRGEDCGVCV